MIVDPSKTILLTTWDFLQQPEAAQRIQSADAIGELARAAERDVPKNNLFAVRDIVKGILSKNRID